LRTGTTRNPKRSSGYAALVALSLALGPFQFWAALRERRSGLHRWMVRNFALTFAAVTLRLWLPGSVVSGVPFGIAYPIVAWLCWVPNLVFAESLLRRGDGPPLQPTPST
jgi:hypothetical protein